MRLLKTGGKMITILQAYHKETGGREHNNPWKTKEEQKKENRKTFEWTDQVVYEKKGNLSD